MGKSMGSKDGVETFRGPKSEANNPERFKRDPRTGRIISCAYKVANRLGTGFLEKVYENALGFELQDVGFMVEQQKAISVYYQGRLAGEYFADLLIDSEVLVELKAAKDLEENHLAQCLNYLRATGLKTCPLINFGQPELKIKRISARTEWGSRQGV
jgi:GxxExxY protein